MIPGYSKGNPLEDCLNQQESYQVKRKSYLYSMFKELALPITRNHVPPVICSVQLIRLSLFDIVDTNTDIQSLPRPGTINDEVCSRLTCNPKFAILILIEKRFLSIQLNSVNSEEVDSTFWGYSVFHGLGCIYFGRKGVTLPEPVIGLHDSCLRNKTSNLQGRTLFKISHISLFPDTHKGKNPPTLRFVSCSL